MKLRPLPFAMLCFFVLASCAETQVDNNIRVLVQGRVVDQENLPIEDANIRIIADANSPGALPALLGVGSSNEDGTFLVTSLFGANESFKIEILSASDYTRYNYLTDASEYRPGNLIFDLETVALRQLSTFNYSIIKESEASNSINFTISFLDTDCFQVFIEGDLDTGLSDCYQNRSISRFLNSNSPDFEGQILVPIQSTIEITYSIDEGEELTELISIDETTYNFELSY